MELVWHSRGRQWSAVLDGVEVARYSEPLLSTRTRVMLGDEEWLFTRRWGRPADAPESDPPPLAARRASWFTTEREVVTPRGTWRLRFPGFVGRTVEVWQEGLQAGEMRSMIWWRQQPVVLRLREDLLLVDAIWITWHGLRMRRERDAAVAGGGGGGDGGGG